MSPFTPTLARLVVCGLAALASSTALAQGLSTLRVTEAMSSSGVGGTADWWEVTNYGSSAVGIAGWKFDDSSFAFANSVALNGVTSIAAGETVAFLETTTLDSGSAATQVAAFRSFWGGSASSAQIGYYAGSGISFSSGGDGLVLYDALGVETTPRVTFGAATSGASFYYSYDSTGNPTTSPNTNAIVSAVGTIDGQVTFLSATSLPQNTGSPGTAINAVPEPTSLATLACGGLLGLGFAARRRRQA
jgi:hypothetical protein